MPIRRDTPRESFRRTLLLSLEKYRLAVASTETNTTVLSLLALAHRFKQLGKKRKMIVCVELANICCSMLDLNSNLANLPRQQSTSCGPMKGPNEFDDSQFYEQFRFRKSHFWMFMQAIRWTLADGSPQVMKVGKKRHRRTIGAQHILMILLRRLAFPSRWCDLNIILGGSTTTNSEAYNFALSYFYKHFVPLVQDLRRWKHKFADFAKRLSDMGAPFDNLISFVDGHFDATARPGGDGCVNSNVWDYQIYNPLHKDHGIMFQGLVLVNGIAMCWGPYAGNDNDAKTFLWTGVVEVLHEIAQELGVTYSHFGDSAYQQSSYLQAIQKCPLGGQLSRSARRFNALMARFRVLIENLFAETDSCFAALQHKQQKRIGRQNVSRMFPVCIFM